MIPRSCDLDSIMAVMETAFDPAFGEAWTRRQVHDALLVGNAHYFLAGDDCRPAGESSKAAGFYLSRTAFDEEELLLFAVVPPLRRRGIGSFLMQRLFADAAERGAKRLLLEMRRGNPAEELYRNRGFEPIGVRKDYYIMPGGKTIDAITFARTLN